MIGKYLIFSSFILSILSSLFYFLSIKNIKFIKYARISYYLLTAGVVFTAMYLLSNILSHNFQFTYIWEHSSKELPDNLLIATFYAGQQGSFLLWAILTTIFGYFLMPYLNKKNYENYSMSVYSLVIAFILLILIIKSPFDFLWQSFPNVPVGHLPENGRGLNPILQNYWITIHPPILFTGYASITVPFVIALGALFKKDYRSWIKVALPWTLLSGGILGFGIMLGGFWAYETLGWGGFWAWDPVENSSLIPWLIIVALIHTMLVAKKNGGLLKTNFILAILAFFFVLYASFLTRSGILGDTSVHSFVDPGKEVYTMLVLMLIAFGVFSFFMFLKNIRRIPVPDKQFNYNSKEFGLSIGAIIISFITFIVIIGTSKPILSDIFAGFLKIERSTVEPVMYNNIVLWLAAIMLLINSYVLFFRWKKSDINLILKQTFYFLLISVILTIILSIFVFQFDFKYKILLFTILFNLVSNIYFIFKSKFKLLVSGTYFSHIGITLLILGALISGVKSENKQIRLKMGETAKFLDYTIAHKGMERIERNYQDREKYQYLIEITKNNQKSIAKPIVYWSNFNNREAPFFEPGINSNIYGDLYISPYSVESEFPFPPVSLAKHASSKVSIDTNYKIELLSYILPKNVGNSVLLSKNEAQKVPLDSTNSIELIKFLMPDAEDIKDGDFKFGAIIQIVNKDLKITDTIYTKINQENGSNDPIWKTNLKLKYQIGFSKFNVNKDDIKNSNAVISFKYLNDKNSEIEDIRLGALVRISSKNFISEDTLFNVIEGNTNISKAEWKQIKNLDFEVGFMKLEVIEDDFSNTKAIFAFKKVNEEFPAPIDYFTMDVSTKPFIKFVWIGTIIMTLGFFISIVKHSFAKTRKIEEEVATENI